MRTVIDTKKRDVPGCLLKTKTLFDTIMELRLLFAFDSFRPGPTGFMIINPPTVPVDGEVIRVHWRDFLDDENFIKKIEAYEEEGCLLARVGLRTYTKDHVTVTVHLIEEDHYDEQIEWEERARQTRANQQDRA